MSFQEVYEGRQEALSVLNKIKKARKGLKTRIVRIDDCTWIEKSEDSVIIKHNVNMKKVNLRDVEQAVAIYRTALSSRKELEVQMREAEEVIDAYGREHREAFSEEGRLILDSGTIAIRPGAVKAFKKGVELPSDALSELAAVLPAPYVRVSFDYDALYAANDGKVRRIMQDKEIEMIREERFVVL